MHAFIYTYIYIYMRVCVCVCARVRFKIYSGFALVDEVTVLKKILFFPCFCQEFSMVAFTLIKR